MFLFEGSIRSFFYNLSLTKLSDNRAIKPEDVIIKNELLKALLTSMDNDKMPANDSTKEF